jgi:hypothetical protein
MSTELAVLRWDDLAEKGGHKVTAEHANVPITFQGKSIEIDLGEDNYVKLRKFLAPYMEAGRKAGAQRPVKGYKHDPRNREFNKGLRTWLESQGRLKEIVRYRDDGTSTYTYTKDIVREYETWLKGQGGAAA